MWSPVACKPSIYCVMAAGIDCARIEVVARTVAAEAGYNNLKSEQVQAVVEFIRGRDVVVSLPTGYIKSLIYGSLPEVIQRAQERRQKTSIALVISSLSVLMLDQKACFVPSGITAKFLGGDTTR